MMHGNTKLKKKLSLLHLVGYRYYLLSEMCALKHRIDVLGNNNKLHYMTIVFSVRKTVKVVGG